MTESVENPGLESLKVNCQSAVESWEGVKSALSDAEAFKDPVKVSNALVSLTQTIPNFLKWGGIDDVQDGKFWESPRAQALLGITDPTSLPRLLLGLEGLKLKAESDRLAVSLQRLEEKQIGLLKKAWEAEAGFGKTPIGKPFQNAFRWGDTGLARNAAADLFGPPSP